MVWDISGPLSCLPPNTSTRSWIGRRGCWTTKRFSLTRLVRSQNFSFRSMLISVFCVHAFSLLDYHSSAFDQSPLSPLWREITWTTLRRTFPKELPRNDSYDVPSFVPCVRALVQQSFRPYMRIRHWRCAIYFISPFLLLRPWIKLPITHTYSSFEYELSALLPVCQRGMFIASSTWSIPRSQQENSLI